MDPRNSEINHDDFYKTRSAMSPMRREALHMEFPAMPRILSFSGRAGCGKNSACEMVRQAWLEHGLNSWCKQMAFADTLKEIVAKLFHWELSIVRGDNESDRRWRELRDPYWTERLGRDVSIRGMLQEIGTDIFRNHLHQEIWVAVMERRLEDVAKERVKLVTISDCRFKNEVELIHKFGGKTYWINRTDQPELDAKAAGHASENSLTAEDCDYVITNDGTSNFRGIIEGILREPQK